jgi:hypothetical protein
MSAKTHPETTLQQPAQVVLGTLEARRQSLSITVVLAINLTVGSVILKALKFVHSRRSGGSEWQRGKRGPGVFSGESRAVHSQAARQL